MVIDLKALEGRLFTVDELAEVTGLHPDSIRRLIREGTLRAVKPLGLRGYRVRGEDAARYLQGLPPVAPVESKPPRPPSRRLGKALEAAKPKS